MLQTTGILSKLAGITLDIEKGDTLLGGRFKNIPMVVKETGTDELGQPTVNGKKLLSFRIKKEMPEKTAMLRTTEILFKLSAVSSMGTHTTSSAGTYLMNQPYEAPIWQQAPLPRQPAYEIPGDSQPVGQPYNPRTSTGPVPRIGHWQRPSQNIGAAFNASESMTGKSQAIRQNAIWEQAKRQGMGLVGKDIGKEFTGMADFRTKDPEGYKNLVSKGTHTPGRMNWELHGDWSKKTNPEMKHTGVFQGSKGPISYSSNMEPMGGTKPQATPVTTNAVSKGFTPPKDMLFPAPMSGPVASKSTLPAPQSPKPVAAPNSPISINVSTKPTPANKPIGATITSK